MPAAPLILAACLSTTLCYLLVRFGQHLPFRKAPSADRWHTRSTPDSGGLAVFAAMATVYLIFFRGQHGVAAAAAAALWLLGTLDDRMQFRARTKFAAQAVVVTLAVAGGLALHASPWPLLNWVLSWLWLMGITNAFNLIDNMDGLAAGAAVIIGTFRGAALWAQGYSEEALLSGLLAAAFAGFLLFNFRPARLFMGDGGSLLAGFSLAALTVASVPHHAGSVLGGLLGPALIFSYPIFDTALVTVLRRAAGRPISVGGRDHSSHRLAVHGVPEAAVVAGLWAFTALGCAAGLLLNRIPAAGTAVVLLLAAFASLSGWLLSALPAQATLRGPEPWPAWRASLGEILDALMTAMVVLAACLSCSGLRLSDAQFGTLLVAVPLVMLVHAAGAAIGRTCPPPWSTGWRFWRPARLTLLVAALLNLMLSAGSFPRGVALAYPLVAFVLGLRLASRPWRRRARPGSDGAEDGRCPVAIYGTGAESRALARFLAASRTYGMRPVVFLESRTHPSEPGVEGLPVAVLERDLARLAHRGTVTWVLLPAAAFTPGEMERVRRLAQQASLHAGTLSFHVLSPRDVAASVAENAVVLV